MSEVLGRILAFERAITDRSVQRRVPFPFGTAFFHDGLPRVWDLNFLQVESAEPTVCDLVEEAERLQGGAGLEHRKIAVDDEGLSRRLEPGFRELEWKVEALVVMPHRRKPTRSADLATTRELSAADLRQTWEHGIRSEESMDDESVRQLVEAQELPVHAAAARYFGTLADGSPASYCSLYSDGRTGQIESVMTLPEFRGRGLATAVILRALDESQRAGHDLTFLLADDEDWPKVLYARLGFEPIGRRYTFTRPKMAP